MSLRVADIADILSSMLPTGVALVVAANDMVEEGLLPEEAEHTGSMVPKRLREFTAGRVAARAALAKLGHEPAPILVGPSREPIWPGGIVGSISHSNGIIAAAVAERSQVPSLGIDIEEATPLDEDLHRMVCTPEEIRWLGKPKVSETSWAGKVVFSAKESLFKCWFPVEGSYLDFLEATLSIDLGTGRWTGRIHRKPENGFPTTVSGLFRRFEGHLFTVCFLPEPKG